MVTESVLDYEKGFKEPWLCLFRNGYFAKIDFDYFENNNEFKRIMDRLVDVFTTTKVWEDTDIEKELSMVINV